MARDVDDPNESEFGLGPGMIDSELRQSRVLPTHQELWEIYAKPKTFDSPPGTEAPDPTVVPVPRLLPGETEADRA